MFVCFTLRQVLLCAMTYLARLPPKCGDIVYGKTYGNSLLEKLESRYNWYN